MNKANGSYLDKELLDQHIDPGASEAELRILRKLFLALRRGMLWLILVPLLAGALVYFLSGFSEKKYTSVAQVMIETRETVETEFAPVVSGLPTSSTTLESELEVLRSLDLIERLVDDFDLVNDPEFMPEESDLVEEGVEYTEEELANIAREMAITAVAKQRSIEQVGSISAVYAISFKTTDPVKSALLANAMAEEYLQTTTSAKLRSLELSQGWLAERTVELQDRLIELGVKREQHIMAAPNSPEEVETIKAKSLSVERRLREVRRELLNENAILLSIAVLRSIGRPDAAASELPDPPPELTAALAAYSAGDADGLQGLEQALDAAVASRMPQRDRVAEQVKTHEEELELLSDVLAEQATHDAELNRIENDILVAQSIYQDFVAQLSRRTQQERYLDADARVIESARPALDPSDPNRKVLTATAVALTFVGTMLALMVSELRHTGLRTVREFEEATGLSLIGVLPTATQGEFPSDLSLKEPQSISPRMMRYARKLRASVMANLRGGQNWSDTERRAGSNGGAKIIAGVSTNPDDGLSLSMLMLAAACVEAGENVLIVDLDFWNSKYVKNYGLPLEEARSILKPNVKRTVAVKTEWPGLSVFATACKNESDPAPFTDEELGQVLAQHKKSFDRILVDTAPIMQRIDATSLSRFADAILYFLRWNSTTTSEMQSALKLMTDVGVHPSAVIATRVDTRKLKRFGERALSYPE